MKAERRNAATICDWNTLRFSAIGLIVSLLCGCFGGGVSGRTDAPFGMILERNKRRKIMAEYNEPCRICEEYMEGVICDKDKCPIAKMKAENEALKKEISRLRLEMSYMKSPNRIGDSHEMGAW